MVKSGRLARSWLLGWTNPLPKVGVGCPRQARPWAAPWSCGGGRPRRVAPRVLYALRSSSKTGAPAAAVRSLENSAAASHKPTLGTGPGPSGERPAAIKHMRFHQDTDH